MTVIFSMLYRDDDLLSPLSRHYDSSVLYYVPGLRDGLSVELSMVHTVKKVNDFPASRRDVTNQTVPGRE